VSPSSPSVGLKTANLTLASFLILRGQEARLVQDGQSPGGHPIGSWEFDSDEAQKLAREYDAGEALVDPQLFHKAVTETRKQMFTFLGIERKG
jgi:hypothetical protein